jgi:hypothetical protein
MEHRIRAPRRSHDGEMARQNHHHKAGKELGLDREARAIQASLTSFVAHGGNVRPGVKMPRGTRLGPPVGTGGSNHSERADRSDTRLQPWRAPVPPPTPASFRQNASHGATEGSTSGRPPSGEDGTHTPVWGRARTTASRRDAVARVRRRWARGHRGSSASMHRRGARRPSGSDRGPCRRGADTRRPVTTRIPLGGSA